MNSAGAHGRIFCLLCGFNDNARHDLLEPLVIAPCAVLCGAENCSDMALFVRAKEAFFLEFLTLRHGVPSHDTQPRRLSPIVRQASLKRG
jgi:hypothetical protein